MIMKEKILCILDEIGISLSLHEDDIDLRDYIVDSIQFISFIITIEEKLEIEFPDELLLYDNLISLNSFCTMLSEVLNKT